jgi:hypothetical protein
MYIPTAVEGLTPDSKQRVGRHASLGTFMHEVRNTVMVLRRLL